MIPVLILLVGVIVAALWVVKASADTGVGPNWSVVGLMVLLVLAVPVGLVGYVYGIRWGWW